ncbi:MAG: hypothetical protein KBS62_03155, partial [Oscillospiraceae bacterium]|nr:hypothetical protein [Candidatus Ruminococcus equi]
MSIASEFQNLKTNISSAYSSVESKGGTIPANKNTDNLSTAIESIPSGGGFNVLEYVTTPISFEVPFDDENVTLDFGNRDVSCTNMLWASSQPTMKNLSLVANKITNLQRVVMGKSILGTLTINADTSACSSYYSSFYGCTNLVNIFGTLNFSGLTDSVNLMFYACGKLINVTFAENTLNMDISFYNSPLLSNNSLISIANGLVAGNYTLTLHATSKVNCDTIMGYVDNTKGYDVFVADESGTVTLSEFITVTKG